MKTKTLLFLVAFLTIPAFGEVSDLWFKQDTTESKINLVADVARDVATIPKPSLDYDPLTVGLQIWFFVSLFVLAAVMIAHIELPEMKSKKSKTKKQKSLKKGLRLNFRENELWEK